MRAGAAAGQEAAWLGAGVGAAVEGGGDRDGAASSERDGGGGSSGADAGDDGATAGGSGNKLQYTREESREAGNLEGAANAAADRGT